MATKAVVLSSGGVDSTTCVALAVHELGSENVTTLSVYYGQRHDKELKCAEKIARYYGVSHIEKDISSVMSLSNCSLLKGSTQKIEHKSYVEQVLENNKGIVNTYVPFRNGLLLSCAAAIALSIYPEDDIILYYGAHADDAAKNAYADCSEEFLDSINRCISVGTYGKVKVKAPFISKNKSQVVKVGLQLGTPYELTWSCYEGGEEPCGKCATCLDRMKAFKDNGISDPLIGGNKYE